MAYLEKNLKKQRIEWVQKCPNLGLDMKERTDSRTRRYDNHMFLVYLHVNKLNKHVYVGITHHVNPYKRWGYSGQHYKHSTKFVNAINKYGWDNFDHYILCRTNKERAKIMETTLIAYYKKLGICYNLADGGEGTDCITEENRRKLRERMLTNHPMKGKHLSPEVRARISAGLKHVVYSEERKRHIASVGALGRKTMRERGWVHSEEGRRKMAERCSKPVLQLDLEGNIIREFPSTQAADRTVNNGRHCGHIADVCNGKRKTASGYKWVYKERKEDVNGI